MPVMLSIWNVDWLVLLCIFTCYLHRWCFWCCNQLLLLSPLQICTALSFEVGNFFVTLISIILPSSVVCLTGMLLLNLVCCHTCVSSLVLHRWCLVVIVVVAVSILDVAVIDSPPSSITSTR